MLYKCGGKLVGERTRRPSMMTVTELQFADDVAVVSATRDSIVRAANVLDEVTSQWGLTMSMSKTKLLVVGEPRVEEDLQPINIRGESIEAVRISCILGQWLRHMESS